MATRCPSRPATCCSPRVSTPTSGGCCSTGSLDLVRKVGREDVVVARMDVPGRWAGGFRAWDDNGIYMATGRGATPGRVLRLDAPRLRELVNHWFPLAGHLIGGLHHTARSIESTVRQRDALVTLGTLAAGLAHEINNPAAAASRTVDDLGQCCDALLEALTRLARDDVTAAQFTRPRRAPPRDGARRTAGRRSRWRTVRASWPPGWSPRRGRPVGTRLGARRRRRRPGLVRAGPRGDRRRRARARPGVGRRPRSRPRACSPS